MKKRIVLWIILAVILIQFTACEESPSQTLEQNEKSKEIISVSESEEIEAIESESELETADEVKLRNDITVVDQKSENIHIKETLKGSSITLNIDLDVVDYPGAEFGIYDTDIIDIDFDEWFTYFFPDTDKNELYNYYSPEGGYNTPELKEKYAIRDDYLETIFSFMDDTKGEEYRRIVQYYHIGEWNFGYSNRVSLYQKNVSLDLGFEGHLRRKEQDFIMPNAEELQNAEDMAYELFSFAFKDEFDNNFILGYAGLKKVDDSRIQGSNYSGETEYEVYLVAYDRYIEGLPILFDDEEETSGYYNYRRPDMLEAYIYEGELIKGCGCIRNLEFMESAEIISASDALSILEVYFETAGISGEFDINRFELMYFPDYTDDPEKLAVPPGGGGAYAKYIPVWVIESGERISPNGAMPSGEYALIIDARNGEIVEKEKR